jgi:hypothetical protein
MEYGDFWNLRVSVPEWDAAVVLELISALA